MDSVSLDLGRFVEFCCERVVFCVLLCWSAVRKMMSHAVSLIKGWGGLKEVRLVLMVGFGGPVMTSVDLCASILFVRSRFLIGDFSSSRVP